MRLALLEHIFNCILQTFAICYLQVPNAIDAYSCSDGSPILKSVSVMTRVDGHDAVIVFVQSQLRIWKLSRSEASRDCRLQYHSSGRRLWGGRWHQRTEDTKLSIQSQPSSSAAKATETIAARLRLPEIWDGQNGKHISLGIPLTIRRHFSRSLSRLNLILAYQFNCSLLS